MLVLWCLLLTQVGAITEARADVTIRPTRAVPLDYSDTSHYVVVEYEVKNTGETLSYDNWVLHLLMGDEQSDSGLHPLVLGFYCQKTGCNPDQFKLFGGSIAPGARLQSIAIFEVRSIPNEATLLLSTSTGDVTHKINLRRVGDYYSVTLVPKKAKK
jgi:hypothetical protein